MKKFVIYLSGFLIYVAGILVIVIGTLCTVTTEESEPPTWLVIFLVVFCLVIAAAECIIHAGWIEKIEEKDKEYNRTHGSTSYSVNVSTGNISSSHSSADRDHSIWALAFLAIISPIAFPIECIVRAIIALL